MLDLFGRFPWGEQWLLTVSYNWFSFKSYRILKFAFLVGFLTKNRQNLHFEIFYAFVYIYRVIWNKFQLIWTKIEGADTFVIKNLASILSVFHKRSYHSRVLQNAIPLERKLILTSRKKPLFLMEIFQISPKLLFWPYHLQSIKTKFFILIYVIAYLFFLRNGSYFTQLTLLLILWPFQGVCQIFGKKFPDFSLTFF